MNRFNQLFSSSIFLLLFSLLSPVVAQNRSVHQGDPSIFYEKGTYYLYGTNDEDSNLGIVVYTSTDQMKSWKAQGFALKKGDAFGDRGFWAPQVWKHLDKFYMAYTANEKIAIAEAPTPIGPFKQKDKAPLAADYAQIDPFIFVDDDAKVYFFHVRLGNGNQVWVAEMTSDFSATKPGTAKACIVANSSSWEHVNEKAGKVAEGPTVIKRAGKYYLFYSANDFRNRDYAVGYAVSDHIYGPWVRYTSNPIIHESLTGQAGSGHGDLIEDGQGKLWYTFHTHNRKDKVGPRRTAIVQLKTSNKNGMLHFQLVKKTFRFLTELQ